MFWPMNKHKTGSNQLEKDKDKEKPSMKSARKSCCAKCGERCKKCGSDCRCTVRRVYVRAPMFNYYTDLMH